MDTCTAPNAEIASATAACPADDVWRQYSRRAGARMERPARILRFSRPLMIFAALAMIVASVFRLI